MRFDSYHPAINFIFFTAVIAASVTFDQPVFLLLSFLCPFIYSVVLNGFKAAAFNMVLMPMILLFAFFYAYYNHFGITGLAINCIGNTITLEALVYGVVVNVKVGSVLMWFSCVHTIISSDKVIYLFGKIAPKLSLLLSITLRMTPRVKAYAKTVNTTQKCIGRGLSQGNLYKRVYNFFRIQSIVATWALENFVSTSDSMRSRGYSLKGRTAFSIYRFDNRDRSFVITLFFCFTVMLAGILFDQTHIRYNPEIILNKMTPLSVVFYVTYALLCLLPMILQVVYRIRYATFKP